MTDTKEIKLTTLEKQVKQIKAIWLQMRREDTDYSKYKVKSAYDRAEALRKRIDKIFLEMKTQQIEML